MSCTVDKSIRIIVSDGIVFAYIFLASLAASSAASAEMLESFKSLLVVIESRAIALTICSGLNSKSISPESQISVYLLLSRITPDRGVQTPESPDLTGLVKYGGSNEDVSDCIRVTVRWWSSIFKVSIAILFYRSWDSNRTSSVGSSIREISNTGSLKSTSKSAKIVSATLWIISLKCNFRNF